MSGGVRRSFWVQGVAAVAIAGLIAVAAVTATVTRDSTLSGEMENLAGLSRMLALHTQRILFGADLLVAALEEEFESAAFADADAMFRHASSRGMYERLVEMTTHTTDIEALGFADANGRLATSRGWPHASASVADREYFVALREGRKQFISAPMTSRITGQQIILMARRIDGPDGRFLGVAHAVISLARFDRLFVEAVSSDAKQIAIVRRDGAVIADTRAAAGAGAAALARELWAVAGPLAERADETRRSGGDVVLGGQPQLMAMNNIPGYPLSVIVTKPESAVLSQWQRMAWLISLFTLAATMLIVLAAIAYQRQARARAELADALGRIAAANEELHLARDAAEAANRAKSIFLANMSHELRTPLNAILGFAQIIERDQRIPDDTRAHLRTINRSGQHLLALINDVLEISKIEAGRLQVQTGALNLQGLLETLIESMTLRARDKGLQLRLDLAAAVPRYVVSDAAKLRQILLNLLSNAVKFTREGEVVLAVQAACQATGQCVLEFAVRDTGIGIPAEDLERIFDAFFQTEAGARQGEGSGLGLAISHEYARLLGGSLSAESVPGQGSVFRCRLPVNLADAPASPSPQGHVRSIRGGERSYRILIVEDEPVNREMLQTWLEAVGFSVRAAGDGRQAVELFRDWPPDFIWMDMRMPVMDGFAATAAIRALPGGDKVPIVAFTASAFDDERQAILAAGCNDIMTKPVEEARLFAVMAQHLGVQFEYDAAPVAAGGEADFGALPQALRLRLREAAQACDGQAIRAIAQDLDGAYPQVARRLRELADAYRFDLIDERARAAPDAAASP